MISSRQVHIQTRISNCQTCKNVPYLRFLQPMKYQKAVAEHFSEQSCQHKLNSLRHSQEDIFPHQKCAHWKVESQ